MAEPLPPFPVKFFIAALYCDSDALERAKTLLIAEWGRIDYFGQDRVFDVTGYYDEEMGSPQIRQIMTFETLQEPTLLVPMKIRCNELEKKCISEGKRVVNLDAGYLDHNKVILASAKEAGQKVYLDNGIYADLAGRYKSGKYQPFEWSFPDFKDGRYDQELCQIRSIYLRQLKEWRKTSDMF
ncbi:MAG: DUF4416 family protein [Chitinispirillaceae bacterium]|nr:DUF4416 family protein [Chitinispirillaceae bacterium]